MKLVRRLLEYAEMSPTEEPLPIPGFDEYNEPAVYHHAGLYEEAGFPVPCQPASTGLSRRFPGILRLTWAGNEALDRMHHG